MTPQPAALARDKNRHLARACWLVVSEHKSRYGAPPTGLYFNKALSLLNRRLGSQGHNLQLPHCWYRYGDEVVRNWIPSQVSWDHDVRTFVGWTGPEPQRPTDSLGKALSESLSGILKEFSASEHIEDMVDLVYDYAPFEFQRSFRQVRRASFDAKASILDQKALAALMSGFVKTAGETFPTSDFPEAAFFAESAFTSAQITLRRDPRQMELVRESLEKFWDYWCYHLRLHEQGHENVPGETLQLWSQEVAPQEREYGLVFLSHFRQMAQSAPELKDMEELQPWVSKLNRDATATAKHVDKWSGVFSNVDDFVQKEKRTYAA